MISILLFFYPQKALPLIEKAVTKIKGRRVSFVCGDPGPLTLGAILYHRLNMTSQVPACIEGLVFSVLAFYIMTLHRYILRKKM